MYLASSKGPVTPIMREVAGELTVPGIYLSNPEEGIYHLITDPERVW